MKKNSYSYKFLAGVLSLLIVFACLPFTGFAESSVQVEDIDLIDTTISTEDLVLTEIPTEMEIIPEPTSIYTEDIVLDDITENNDTVDTMSTNNSSSNALTVHSYAGPPSEDTYISGSNSSASYGSSTKLWLSSNQISYIKYDLSFLPEGAIITNAYIIVPYYFRVTSGYLYVGAYEIEESWNESTLTWNNANIYSNISTTLIGSEQKATARTGQSESNHDSITFDITDLANKWVYSGENNGLALKYSSTADNINDDLNTSVILLSKENYNAYGASIFIQYVVLEDGVYSFENVGNENRYMDIQQNKTSAGYHVQQYNFTTAPETSFSRSGLYKITRDPETGRHIIRLMLNNNLSFGISGNEVLTKEISMDDTLVSQADMFTIEFAGDGYIIKPYNSDLIVSTNATYENASGGVNSYLLALSEESAEDNGLWIPTKYTGTDKFGLTASRSGSLIAGEQVTISAVSWSTVPRVNRQDIYTHYSCENVATSSMNITTGKMTMNIHDEGTIKVIYDICNDDTHLPIKSYVSNLTAELPFEEGMYFFNNKQNGQYMQIDNDSGNNYSTNLAKLELGNIDGDLHQKWNVTHVSDGYYKITSEKSGLAVSVQENYTNQEHYLVQETYYSEPRQLWNFEYDTTVEAYIVRPKSAIGSNTDWCMCGEYDSTVELDVQQSDHIDNDSYLDYWIIEDALLYVEFSYDYGFIDLLQKDFESTEETKERITNQLTTYLSLITEAFRQKVGINLALSPNDIDVYESDADKCSNRTEDCTCVTACELEHNHDPNNNNSYSGFDYESNCKCIVRLRNNLIYQIPDHTIRVTYSGHTNSCGAATGLSDYVYPIIAFAYNIDESQYNNTENALTLAHEISHTFGIAHHDTIEGYNCIMQENDRYSSVNFSPDMNIYDIWCPNCIQTIKNERLRHFEKE